MKVRSGSVGCLERRGRRDLISEGAELGLGSCTAEEVKRSEDRTGPERSQRTNRTRVKWACLPARLATGSAVHGCKGRSKKEREQTDRIDGGNRPTDRGPVVCKAKNRGAIGAAAVGFARPPRSVYYTRSREGGRKGVSECVRSSEEFGGGGSSGRSVVLDRKEQ